MVNCNEKLFLKIDKMIKDTEWLFRLHLKKLFHISSSWLMLS